MLEAEGREWVDSFLKDAGSLQHKKSYYDPVKAREQLSTNLKAAVETAREKYNEQKEVIKAEYEQIYQREFDAIVNS